jgi:hypothetical protein
MIVGDTGGEGTWFLNANSIRGYMRLVACSNGNKCCKLCAQMLLLLTDQLEIAG